jgi:hypothetical protein
MSALPRVEPLFPPKGHRHQARHIEGSAKTAHDPDRILHPLKRTPADNQTVRNVFVIGPDKKVKLILVYPMTTGRNFDEVLRVIDSLQLTAAHKVATPVNWKHGDNVIIVPAVSDEDARKQYPQGWTAPRPYLRIVPQPGR